MSLIFDLDQTLVDSSIAESARNKRAWSEVYPLIPRFRMYEGVRQVLGYLEENQIKFCVVTTSPRPYCDKVCAHWNIRPELSICYHDASPRKPHPAPILMALTKMNVQADQAISFGDRDIDIIASNKAGVRSVACLWGAANPKSLIAANPFKTIGAPTEIIQILKNFYSR